MKRSILIAVVVGMACAVAAQGIWGYPSIPAIFGEPVADLTELATKTCDALYEDQVRWVRDIGSGAGGIMVCQSGSWDAGSVSVHADLTGNEADDHTQYGALAQDEIVTGDWTADRRKYDTGATPAAHDPGTAYWCNNNDDVLCFDKTVSGVTVQISQETHLPPTINKEGATIVDMQAVYVCGFQASFSQVCLAQADSASTAGVVGLVTQASCLNNQSCVITSYGLVNDIDTSSLSEGPIYLSATVAGALTNTVPVGPDSTMFVGIVTNSHPTDGVIFVSIGVDFTEQMTLISAYLTGELTIEDGLAVNSDSDATGDLTVQGDTVVDMFECRAATDLCSYKGTELGSGGGGSPGGVSGDVQINDGASGFAASIANDDGTNLTIGPFASFQTSTTPAAKAISVIDDATSQALYVAGTASNAIPPFRVDADGDGVLTDGSVVVTSAGNITMSNAIGASQEILFERTGSSNDWAIKIGTDNQFRVQYNGIDVIDLNDGGTNRDLDFTSVGTGSITLAGAGGSLVLEGDGDVVVGAGDLIQNGPNGSTWTRADLSEEMTLNTGGTTTDSAANLLPADSVIHSIVCRITTTITTATDWSVGDGTTTARFCAANATLTAGTTSVCLLHRQGSIATDATGPVQTAAASLRITTTGTPGAGAIRCTVFAESFTAPTS